MRLTTWLLAGVACLSSAAGAAAQETDVDLELVLAVDVSRSMDPSERDLQKQGYIEALQHPDVLAAIRAGFLGQDCRHVRGVGRPWRAPYSSAVDPDRRAGVGRRLRGQDRSQSQVSFLHGTSISGGLLFASGLFEKSVFRSARQVIDVSGDGPNNMGLPVLKARAVVLERGITINGLPIMINADYVRRLLNLATSTSITRTASSAVPARSC